MRLFNIYKAIVLTGALTLIAPYASASIISFDFTTLNSGNNNTQLGTSESVNNVEVSGYRNSGSGFNSAHLWQRNQTNDRGLGVCSEGQTSCTSGGGDVNELDNAGNYEAIVLHNNNGPNSKWSQLFVSSLDDNNIGPNGIANPETGTLFWGDSLTELLGMTNSFSFHYGDFGNGVEGDILSLAAASAFDPMAGYLGFVAGSPGCANGGTCNGSNNDYLVWKGTIDPGIDAPEPAALGLFGMALLMLGFGLRRKRSL